MEASECSFTEQAFIDLIPVSPTRQPLPFGALTLSGLSCLPNAYDSELEIPGTERKLAVPHGNLIAYAEHLIQERNDPATMFVLQFRTYSGCCSVSQATTETEIDDLPPELLAELEALREGGKLLDLNDPEVQQSIKEGRMVIRTAKDVPREQENE